MGRQIYRNLPGINNEFLDPKRRQAYYDEDKDVYFFDRHRPSFPAILYFYQSCGAMCRPLDVPMGKGLHSINYFRPYFRSI